MYIIVYLHNAHNNKWCAYDKNVPIAEICIKCSLNMTDPIETPVERYVFASFACTAASAGM